MDLHPMGWGTWTGMASLKIGTGSGSCECGKESWALHNAGVFLISCQIVSLLGEGSPPWSYFS